MKAEVGNAKRNVAKKNEMRIRRDGKDGDKKLKARKQENRKTK